MSRYTPAFKHSVVEFYGSGERGYREVSKHFGLDHATVRHWVALHAAHGSAGLIKKFSHYDGAFRLSVLKRIWEDKLSLRQTAAIFNIRSRTCISDWEKLYESGGIEALAPRRRGRPRSMPETPIISQEDAAQNDEVKSREELLAELNYLRMENAYLKKLKALTLQHAQKKRNSFKR